MAARFPRLFHGFATKAYSPRPFIGRYTDKVPVELSRVQSSVNVKLRDYETQLKLKNFSYDVKLVNGKVLPMEGPNFTRPNGCSLREPASPAFQELARNFRGENTVIHVIPKGTPLPPSLTVLHVHSDLFSMQCTRPMTLDELNDELTNFISANAKTMDREQFFQEYPSTL